MRAGGSGEMDGMGWGGFGCYLIGSGFQLLDAGLAYADNSELMDISAGDASDELRRQGRQAEAQRNDTMWSFKKMGEIEDLKAKSASTNTDATIRLSTAAMQISLYKAVMAENNYTKQHIEELRDKRREPFYG